MTVWNTLLTFVVAITGTALFVKLKVPAGAFIGAIIFVGTVQILTGLEYFPSEVKVFCSALCGSYLGTRVHRSDLDALLRAPLAAAIMSVAMVLYCIITGWLLSSVTDMDFPSAVLGMAPGGSTEFALVANDMGYQAAAVTILQIIRMALVVPLIPVSARFIMSKWEDKLPKKSVSVIHVERGTKNKSISGFFLALLIGIPMGILGKLSGMPAGAMTFSMASVAVVNVLTDKLYFPLPVRYFANSCNGALVGVKLCVADLVLIGSALPAVLLIDLSWIVLSGLLGILVYRMTDFSLATSLFACAPGGISDLSLVAEDMGGNPTQVMVMQLFRLIFILLAIPNLIIFGNLH